MGIVTIALAVWVFAAASVVASVAPVASRRLNQAQIPTEPENAGVTVAEPGGWFEASMFYLFAGATVISAIGVCVTRNVVRMATWLFFALGSVAVLYFLLAASFLAAIQLIVYVGGVLILLIFGVMLTSKSPWARFEVDKKQVILAAMVCGVLLACLVTMIYRGNWGPMAVRAPGVAVERFGRRLLTDYLVPFEVAGVLLMIVMVGAAHLARQEK